jgi:hypothetical protein
MMYEGMVREAEAGTSMVSKSKKPTERKLIRILIFLNFQDKIFLNI